jgi:hypothetical protein
VCAHPPSASTASHTHADRKHADAADPATIEKLLGKANSTLGYLKIVTPRGARQGPQQGVTRITFGPTGAEAARPGKAVSNWSGSNVDPDALKRHQRSLSRAGFKGHRDAKGIF